MKSERILYALGGINDEYITEAAPAQYAPAQYEAKRAAKNRAWLKWGTLAACAAVVIFAGIRLVPRFIPISDENELQMLTIGENMSGDMGYEGLLAYDVSELINANPWTEDAELDSLPVYKNQLYYDENYQLRGHDPEQMQEALIEVAGRLGMDVENLTITDNLLSKDEQEAYRKKADISGRALPEDYFQATRYTVEDENYEVDVDQQMCVTIDFKEPVALPESYNFTDSASPEELRNAAEYLLTEYRELIGMDDPQINISGGDYNIYGEQHHEVSFYEGAGNLTERIVEYNFSSVVFYTSENGTLRLARLYSCDLSEKVGEYPIISADEAREILLDGGYITSVPYELPDEKYIAKVELVYRNGLRDTYFMPYYRFLVELPDATVPSDTPDGLKTYGAYYVPAVESKYITDMPVWDGSFN